MVFAVDGVWEGGYCRFYPDRRGLAYSEKWADKATIIYKEGYCVGDNRNTIMQWCRDNDIKRLLMLDDDITSLNVYVDEKHNRPITEKAELIATLMGNFKFSAKNKAPMWGVYPVDNPYFQKKAVRDKALLIGTCLGIQSFAYDFNREYRVKEDYELCCRYMSQGYNILRFDTLSVTAKHYSKGGCADDWKGSTNSECALMLETEYPELVKRQSKNLEEIQFKNKSKNLWQKNTMEVLDGQQK